MLGSHVFLTLGTWRRVCSPESAIVVLKVVLKVGKCKMAQVALLARKSFKHTSLIKINLNIQGKREKGGRERREGERK